MSTTNLYQGLEPGKTTENVNYSVDLFLGVGEGTYNNHIIAKDQGVLMPGQVMGLSTADGKLYVVDDGGALGEHGRHQRGGMLTVDSGLDVHVGF